MHSRIFQPNTDLDLKKRSKSENNKFAFKLTRVTCDMSSQFNNLAVVTVIILVFNFNVNNIKCQSGRFNLDDKLKKINEASHLILNRYAHTQKDYLAFLNKIDGFDAKNLCPTLTQSDLQAKIKRFKSIISECPGYKVCKLGMRQNGSIYGELDPRLESKLYFFNASINFPKKILFLIF